MIEDKYNKTVNTATGIQTEYLLKNVTNQYIKPIFYSKGKNTSIATDAYSGVQVGEREEIQYYNGKQVFTTLEIGHDNYQTEVYNINTKRYELATIPKNSIFLDTVLVEITTQKNIVTSAINGLQGTVKEFITNGDYSITINGLVVNPNGPAYPEDKVKQLQAILNAPVTLNAISDFLSLFGIYSIVITGFTCGQETGLSNTQKFSITALSDSPLELASLK